MSAAFLCGNSTVPRRLKPTDSMYESIFAFFSLGWGGDV